MNWTPPTSEEQVLFLRNSQRLLTEGQFTASYKFALLLALADLCVLKGDDSGGPLELTAHDIAEKFVELYWPQCRPFEMGGLATSVILQQNTGKQAAIITGILQAQRNRVHATEMDVRLAEAELPHDFAAAVRIVAWAYEQTEQAKGQVWVAKEVFRHLGPEWRRLLVA